MNRNIPNCLTGLLAGGVLFSLAGCAMEGMQPIASKPPVAKLSLATPYRYGWWEGLLPPLKYTLMFPAGEYRPLFEDGEFYYYQAPTKVVYRSAMDPGTFLYDGGVYVAPGMTSPSGWYYVDQYGGKIAEEFKTTTPFKATR